ncbi:MAG: NAD-binding protein [Gemmatimonadetes bacterium]|nr:NAD-binding protein [Gemmatimonadota bacterium]
MTAKRFHRPGSPPANKEISEFEKLRRRILTALVALVAVIATGVVGFELIGGEQASLVNSIYMTVITLTTVGFGEIIDMSNHPGGRIFTMVLLLLGMGIVAYTIPMLSALVIEGQLNHLFARRRMLRKIESMKDHYIVCGDTVDASYVAEELARSGRDVVFIAPTDEALVAAAERLGELPGMVGDPTDDKVLNAAAVGLARGVVAGMHEDKDNILVVLTARRLAPKARIIASTKAMETESKLRVAGADGVVSPSRIGGMRIASELVRPTVVRFLDEMLRDRRADLRIEEIAIPRQLSADHRQLSDLWSSDVSGVVLLAIRQPDGGAFEFRPPVSTTLRAGMTLVVMTDRDGRERLEAKIRKWEPETAV